VERWLVPAESPFAATVGYSRAVRAGKHVHVAGTAPIMPDDADPPPGPYGQAKRCLQIIVGALLEVGASPADVVGMVVRHGLKLPAIGLAVGVAASLAGTRVLSHVLFGVSATDPVTFVSTVAALLAAAVAACYLPARRATRIDPISALRSS